jgi:hypothetical protein
MVQTAALIADQASGRHGATDPATQALVTTSVIARETEQAVRDSGSRLRLALTAARIVAWHWNPVEDTVVASDNAADVFGLLPGSTVEASMQGFALVHPDDVDRHRATLMKAIEECGQQDAGGDHPELECSRRENFFATPSRKPWGIPLPCSSPPTASMKKRKSSPASDPGSVSNTSTRCGCERTERPSLSP